MATGHHTVLCVLRIPSLKAFACFSSYCHCCCFLHPSGTFPTEDFHSSLPFCLPHSPLLLQLSLHFGSLPLSGFTQKLLFLGGLLEIFHKRETSSALAQPEKLCAIPAHLFLLHMSLSDTINIIPLFLQYSPPCPSVYKLHQGRKLILFSSVSLRLQ